MSQFKKMQADLRNQGQVKWKHVMHLLRLLLSGIEVLQTGHVPVRMGCVPRSAALDQTRRGAVGRDRFLAAEACIASSKLPLEKPSCRNDRL